MRIISLSTIPPRFERIGPTLASLLGQDCRIDEIRLNIPQRYRRFPEYDGSVPQVPEGVRITRSETDLGPASKILFAAADLRGTDAQILFCDDDRIYSRSWARELFETQKTRSGECVALVGKDVGGAGISQHRQHQPRAVRSNSATDIVYRLRKIPFAMVGRSRKKLQSRVTRRLIRKAGYADLFQGWGGVVIRPDFFDEVAYDIPPVLWTVDDVWLSGMLARRNIPIWLPDGLHNPLKADVAYVDALKANVLDGATRAQANAQCVAALQDRFKIWS